MPRESLIQIYRSTTASNAPSLTAGELAVNIPDKKLFVGGTSGNITFLDASAHVTTVNGLTSAINITGDGGSQLVSVSGTTITIGNRLASSTVTGVASFGNEFVVTSGAVGLTSNYVKSVNGLTGAVVSIATTGSNTFTGLNSFNAGLSASGATFSGDIAVQGGDITTSSATATVFNTTATTLNFGGAATTLIMGATSGFAAASIRSGTITLGSSSNTINTNSGSTNYLALQPYGNVILQPTTTTFGFGSITSLIVTNDRTVGQVQIGGGDLYLGTKSNDGYEEDFSHVNIIFEGASDNTNETTLTVVDPTADRTISLPDASGTVALTNNVVTTVNGLTSAITITGSGAITQTVSGTTTTFGARLASSSATGVASFGNEFTVSAAGAVGLTSNYVKSVNGLTGAVVSIATTGANTFTALNTFNAGISAAGGVTFSGTLKGVTATFSGNVTAQSTLYTDNILATGTQINIANAASGRVAIGDFDSNGNSTFVFVRDNISTLYISNPFGDVSIGDPNFVDSGYVLVYNAAAGYLDGGNSSLTNFSTGSFSGLLTATAGISAAGGVTFAGSLRGTTSSFTGLVSSTVGFSGPGTNITGLVSSFNGLTGAVTGVSHVNGLTGGLTFAAGTGITFTASAGTITLSTTGGGGSKTYAVYTPLDNQPPAANFATIDTRNSIMVLDFDAATDESAVFVGVIPEAASLGSGLKIRINWMATSATSGTCRWGVQIERMNTDEDSDSFDTAATAGSTTNGTSGIITTTEITITTIDSVAAGDPFRIKVFRDADGTSGTDDMTGDAELVSVEVRSAA